MVKSLILAAALAATVASEPEASAPSAGAVEAGDWRLSDARARVSCTLKLTREAGIGGLVVKAPLACRRAFPPLKDLSAWATDSQGGIVLVTTARTPIITFPRAAGGSSEAKAPDGKVWRLTAIGAARPTPASLNARQQMTGAFRLAGPGGDTVCELNLTSNMFATGGNVSVGVCLSPWSDRTFATWTLARGRITLLDRARRPILVLHSEGPGAFITADERAEAFMLVRR